MKDQQVPLDKAHPSGPVNVGDVVITVDRDLCIGAATCLAAAIKAFGIDGDQKSIILNSALEEKKEHLLEAVRSCPTSAIKISETNKDG
jgi:ferredoxin